jgi:hypothetical protein
MELVFVSQVLCFFLGASTWLRDDKLTTLCSHWSCLVYFLLVQGSCCPCVSCSRTQKSKPCVVITCRVHVFSDIVTDLVLSYVKLTSVHSVPCYQRTLLWDYRQVAKIKNCTADLFCGRCPVLTYTLLVRGATFLLMYTRTIIDGASHCLRLSTSTHTQLVVIMFM